jgi:hypothetical protein
MARYERTPGSAFPRFAGSPWFLAAVCVFAVGVQALALNAWFAFDDWWFLASARDMGFWAYARRAFDIRAVGSLPELDRYRPLWPLWFRIQYELFGLHGVPYHAVAIALHLATALLVQRLGLRLGLLTWQANVAAAIFALHPAYAMAVAWVSGANRVVAALPAIGSLLCWLGWVQRRSKLELGAAIGLFLVASLLHPTAVPLAAVYPALAWLRQRDNGRSLSRREMAAWLPIGMLAMTLVGVHLWVRAHYEKAGAFTLGWHIWANYGAMLGMAMAPACESSVGCYRPPFTGLAELALLIGSALFVLAAVATLRWYPIRSLPVVALAWFILTLAPDATLVMGAFGRTMYLAGAPLALWAAGVLPPAVHGLAARVQPWWWRLGVGATAAAVGTAVLLANVNLVLGVHEAGRENVLFVAALRRAIPTLPAGTTLVIEGAPLNLTVFDDTRLQALIDVYYDGVTARSASRADDVSWPVVWFTYSR